MIRYFTKILGIDNIPRWLLYHLLFFSAALGALQAILSISAISEFIASDNTAYYPEAIAFSGLLGIILFSFYKYIIKNFSYRKSLLFFYLIISFTVFVALYLPIALPDLARPVLLFIIFVPINLLNEQFIAGVSDRLPFQKHIHNIRRYAETLYLTGSLVAGIILSVLHLLYFKPHIFLPILVLLAVIAIETNFILKRLEVKKNLDEEKIDSVINTFTDTPLKINVLNLLMFIFLSVINFICIDYIFINKLNTTFPELNQLSVFIGFFWVALMLITILFKLFVYQNLIKTFQLNKAIFLPPAFFTLAVFALNAGYFLEEKSHPLIINITLILLFTRFFVFVLRESFEHYSIRLVFSAISLYTGKTISNIITSLFTLWGYLFSGLVLLLIMSFELFTVKNILYLNIFITIWWILTSVVLVKNYRSAIQKIISKLANFSNSGQTSRNLSLKERVMITTNLSGLKYLLNFQRYYQPFNFEKNIENIPSNIQDKLGLAGGMIDPSEYSTNLHEPSKYQIGKNNALNYYDSDVSVKLTDIENLASSNRIKDRIRAVNMIEKSHNFSYSGIFKMLIKDQDDEVKRNAIMASVTYYNSDILSEIIKYINHEEFATLVLEVLAKIGDDALPCLTNLFYRTDTDQKTQSQILKITGKIASTQATGFLIDKLNYPNKWIIKETVDALIESALKPELRENENLNNAIFKTIHVLAWLLAKEVSLENILKSEPLKKALDDEYQVTFDLLFKLLHLKYRNGIIDFVNQNIKTGQSNEIKELYVELISFIIDEDIKARLFPLLHNNQPNEKVQQLSRFYPISKTEPQIAIRDLLNSDYEYISIWTRACALKLYIETEEDLEKEEIIAQVFNPELMIAELAFFGIYKKKPQQVEYVTNRLPAKLKNRIVSVLNKGPLYEYSLTFYKVLNLQKISYFQKMMGHYLVPFAEVLNDIYLAKNESTFLKCSDEEVLPVFFEPYGEVALFDSHKRKIRLNQNYLYGLGLYSGGVTIEAFSDSIIYIAQPEQIGYLVIHYEELSAALFKYIQNSNFY